MRSILLVLVLWAPLGMAADDRTLRMLLDGYEWDLDSTAILSMGPDTPQRLMAIAEDEEAGGVVRARALIALGLFQDDQVWLYFESKLGKEQSSRGRRDLMDIMCDAFADKRSSRLEVLVTPLLEASEAPERVRAAHCLRRLGTQTAALSLEAYRSRITGTWEYRAAGFKEILDD